MYTLLHTVMSHKFNHSCYLSVRQKILSKYQMSSSTLIIFRSHYPLLRLKRGVMKKIGSLLIPLVGFAILISSCSPNGGAGGGTGGTGTDGTGTSGGTGGTGTGTGGSSMSPGMSPSMSPGMSPTTTPGTSPRTSPSASPTTSP